MSAHFFISTEHLAELVAAVTATGTRVIAPVTASDGTTTYSPITSLEQAALNGALPMPSLKAHFLPPSETLLSWRQQALTSCWRRLLRPSHSRSYLERVLATPRRWTSSIP